jgi:hypothetical protein
MRHDPAVTPVPFGHWTRRDNAVHRREFQTLGASSVNGMAYWGEKT